MTAFTETGPRDAGGRRGPEGQAEANRPRDSKPPILAAALHAQSLGLDVMPCLPRKKWPGRTDWQTRDPYTAEELRAHWVREPRSNYGIRTGRPIGDGSAGFLAVADMDAIDHEALAEVQAVAREWLGDWSAVPETLSGGGIGCHLFYRTETPAEGRTVRESPDLVTKPDGTKKRRWKLELKGAGHQVIGAGSVHPDTGRTYKWSREFTPDAAPLLPPIPPHWLDKPKPQRSACNPGGIVQPSASAGGSARRRLLSWLASCAEAVRQAPEGDRNTELNKRTASAAGARIGAEELDPGEVRSAMLPAALASGLEEGESLATIASALRFAEANPFQLPDRPRPLGAAPSGDAPPDPETLAAIAALRESDRARKVSGTPGTDGDGTGDGEPAGAGAWLMQADEALARLPPPCWLVRDWLEVGAVGVLFGPSGHGKSFVLADLLCSIASGREWGGRRVTPGPVVALIGEGRGGFLRRLEAWKRRHGVTDRLPLYVSPEPLPLDADRTADFIAAELARVAELAGEPPVLVTVDTMRTHLQGDDNESTATAAYFRALRAACKASGAASLTVHHTGHAAPDRERGSSNIRGELDLSARVTKDGDRVTVEAVKVRDGDNPPAVAFNVERLELGIDAEGEPIRSGVAIFAGNTEATPRDREPTRAVLDAMQAAGDAWRCTEGETADGWPILRESAARAYIEGAGGNWKRLQGQLRTLAQSGRLKASPDGWRVTCPDWRFQLVGAAGGDVMQREAEQAAARRQAEEAGIVAALKVAAGLGLEVFDAGSGPKATHNVLAAALEQCQAPRMTPGQFREALRRLIDAGRVTVETVRTPDRKTRAVLRLATPEGEP